MEFVGGVTGNTLVPLVETSFVVMMSTELSESPLLRETKPSEKTLLRPLDMKLAMMMMSWVSERRDGDGDCNGVGIFKRTAQSCHEFFW